jgi:hypothetical protein
MMFILAVLFAAQATSPMLGGYDQITPKVAAARIVRCGVGPVTVRSDEAIEEDVLVVVAKSTITDEQIACIAKAASFYDVELPRDAQPRLDAITRAKSAALVKAEGRRWLTTHHLLGKLPQYEAGVTDDESFARSVEELCGASGALHSQFGVHALNPAWANQQQGMPKEDGPFACVINAALASGFEFAFIGNERAKP